MYYGFRPKDSLEAHREFSCPDEGKYHFKFPPHSNVIDIALLGKKIRPTEPLPFTGMNPDITDPEELVFDSRFESGNLDMAVKTSDNEYDLYMRVDANTRGHHQWFYFSVQNKSPRKVRFNLVNFTKDDSLYNQVLT